MNTNDKRVAVLHAANAERYRKLRAWIISAERFRATDTNCGASDMWFLGPTFDAAVDALPEPDSSHGAEG